MTKAAPFTTITEARDWFENGQAQHGKRAFTATTEYHDHYEAFRALDAADRAARKAIKTTRKAEGPRPASLLAHSLRGTATA